MLARAHGPVSALGRGRAEIFAAVAVIYVIIGYPGANLVEYIEARLDISRAKHVEARAEG